MDRSWLKKKKKRQEGWFTPDPVLNCFPPISKETPCGPAAGGNKVNLRLAKRFGPHSQHHAAACNHVSQQSDTGANPNPP